MTDPDPGAEGFHAAYESAIPGPGADWTTGFDEVNWSGPTPVMLRALELVQADVDAAGLGAIRLSYALAGGTDEYPIINVQWSGTWTSDSIEIEAADLAVASVDVASHVAQGLIELEGVYLPTCPEHRKRASASLSPRHAAIWTCNKKGVTPHVLAPIGELQLIPAKFSSKGPLWRNLADLGPP
jgi:hypothetical protein